MHIKLHWAMLPSVGIKLLCCLVKTSLGYSGCLSAFSYLAVLANQSN